MLKAVLLGLDLQALNGMTCKSRFGSSYLFALKYRLIERTMMLFSES